MGFFKGLSYNLKGLRFGLNHPRLMLLGLIRFAVILSVTVLCAILVVVYYREIAGAIWAQPQIAWLSWLWHLFSWIVALMLFGGAALAGFLISQILFAVVIMDLMSRKTEQLISGSEQDPPSMPAIPYFFFLLRQEIPRAVLPVLFALVLMGLGLMTPFSPVTSVISPLAAVVFLAWDNTDLLPARRMESFSKRFRFLLRTLPLHLGFGLWFLIPLLNVLFLSFAPVGATMVHLERDSAD
ncbi:MAG: EI24 domain-containing protein [Desulfobacterales bacterium]|nr:EI24 domain-containing protein [Desulfobacterales bacterium]